ncbi:MAG: ribbon-helix-helix domain-containing protein [Chitinispirillia bacterium]|nr:ribbon-helix-helix domain-containing protein [Chitinispirillia bacterium]MCL2268390.1 ribbon-helix-helix domain-containing protein [Chitinispirillia bacterium]
MAVLTVNIPLMDVELKQVDDFARKEEKSREEVIRKAIEFYLREKTIDELNAHGQSLGLTPEIIAEEIRRK